MHALSSAFGLFFLWLTCGQQQINKILQQQWLATPALRK